MGSGGLPANCTTVELSAAMRGGGRWTRMRDAELSSMPNYLMNDSMDGRHHHHRLNGSLSSYLEASTYAWSPLESAPRPCHLPMLDHNDLCRALSELRLQHILFVGDSLLSLMQTSLLKIIGHSAKKCGLARCLKCDHGTVRIEDVRNDGLDDGLPPPCNHSSSASANRQLQCPPFSTRHCHTCACSMALPVPRPFAHTTHNPMIGAAICQPFLGKFYSAPESTLLIMNLGAHVHSLEHFDRNFLAFLVDLDRVATLRRARVPAGRHDRLLFFSSCPGHARCSEFDAPVAQPPDQLLNDTTSKAYSWDLMPLYSAHVRAKLADATSRASSVPPIIRDITMLDVEAMTWLRPDGHLQPNADCLHYTLPGVPDWWNAALFAQLRAWQTDRGDAR